MQKIITLAWKLNILYTILVKTHFLKNRGLDIGNSANCNFSNIDLCVLWWNGDEEIFLLTKKKKKKEKEKKNGFSVASEGKSQNSVSH